MCVIDGCAVIRCILVLGLILVSLSGCESRTKEGSDPADPFAASASLPSPRDPVAEVCVGMGRLWLSDSKKHGREEDFDRSECEKVVKDAKDRIGEDEWDKFALCVSNASDWKAWEACSKDVFHTARREQALQFLKNIRGAVQAHCLQYKMPPDTLEGLIQTPDGMKLIESVPKDPWGNEYQYEVSGSAGVISIIGPYGRAMVFDDIIAHFDCQGGYGDHSH